MPLLEPQDGERDWERAHVVEVVDFARLIGVLLGVAGLIVIALPDIIMPRVDPRWKIAGAAVLMIAPGVLYIVVGFFLIRLHHWAWVAMVVMTWVLLASVCVLFAWNFYQGVTTSRGHAGDAALTFGSAIVGVSCWVTALVVILKQLRLAAPEVREATHRMREGFGVLTPGAPLTVRREEEVKVRELE